MRKTDYKEIEKTVLETHRQFSSEVKKDKAAYDVISRYAGYDAAKINILLDRGMEVFEREYGDLSPEKYRRDIHALSLLMREAPKLPQDMVVYRVVEGEEENVIKRKRKYKGYIRQNKFLSTSLLHENTVHLSLKIHVKEGVPCIYIDQICNRGEKELLLPRGGYLYFRYLDQNECDYVFRPSIFRLLYWYIQRRILFIIKSGKYELFAR